MGRERLESRVGYVEWLVRSSMSRAGGAAPAPYEVVDGAPFDFASGTLVLLTLGAGAIIDRLSIVISEAFDVPASIALGTTAEPTLLVASGDVATFDSPALTEVVLPDLLRVVVSAPGATRGAGTVLFKVIP